MKAGKDLVGKKLFSTDTPGKHFSSFDIPDQTKNGVIGVLVISLLGERIDYLTDTASAKEVAAYVLVDKTVDAVQQLFAIIKDFCYAIHGVSLLDMHGFVVITILAYRYGLHLFCCKYSLYL